jgi:hypothetical protein
MSIYCAQSSLDVLETWWSGNESNSFQNYRWSGAFGHEIATLFPHIHQLADLHIQHGDLSCSFQDKERHLKVNIDGIPKEHEEVSTHYGVNASLNRGLKNNPSFGGYAGMQSVADSNGSRLRALYGLEYLISSDRPDLRNQISENWYTRNIPQWGIGLGYSGVAGDDDTGHGIAGHLYVPFPKVNLTVGLLAGSRYYGGNNSKWTSFEELRVEWGMHLGSLFFGVGHDHFTRPDRTFGDGMTLQAGVSIAFPWSRVRK